MYKTLAIEQWNRKEHFHFFKTFEEPFFGITLEVDSDTAWHYCQKRQLSFFLYCLYQALQAANQVESFRYRISGDDVYIYDMVHASPTIDRDNGTFGFAYMNYYPSFDEFAFEAQQEIQRVKQSTGLEPAINSENVIHFSSLPWISFKGLSHARSFRFADSCPKISFGKIFDERGKKFLPVSIHVHHALMDGYHVAQWVDRFQEGLQSTHH